MDETDFLYFVQANWAYNFCKHRRRKANTVHDTTLYTADVSVSILSAVNEEHDMVAGMQRLF